MLILGDYPPKRLPSDNTPGLRRKTLKGWRVGALSLYFPLSQQQFRFESERKKKRVQNAKQGAQK